MKLPKFERTMDRNDEFISLLCGVGIVLSALQHDVTSILWIASILLARLQINELRKGRIDLLTLRITNGAKIEVEQSTYNKRESDSECFYKWNERWGNGE